MEPLYPFVIFNDNIKKDICQEKIAEQLKILNQRKREQLELLPQIIRSWKKARIYSEQKEERLRDCGTMVGFSSAGEITSANFCKDKLCPICQWRKSRKVFGEIMQMQKIIEKTTDNFAMLTLTLKNCDNLAQGITHILTSFYNFSNDRTFKKNTKGFIRTLEITYNTKTEQWHPHLHLVIALTDDYFEHMITTEKWGEIWRRACRIEYSPIIDIRAIGKSETMREKAVAEVAKYAIKPFQTNGNYEDSLKAYSGLYAGTKKRRLRSYGGEYAKARKVVKASADEEIPHTNLFFKRKSDGYELYDYIFKQTENC